jgi:hypothetical protein
MATCNSLYVVFYVLSFTYAFVIYPLCWLGTYFLRCYVFVLIFFLVVCIFTHATGCKHLRLRSHVDGMELNLSTTLTLQSMYQVLVVRMEVSWYRMQCPESTPCLAMADLSGCSSRMYR